MRKEYRKFQKIRPWIIPLTLLLASVTTLSFLLALSLAGQIYDYQDSFDGSHLPQVDAIVCLAGGRGRLAAAGDLWFRYLEQSAQSPGYSPDKRPPVLYFSGLGPQTHWPVVSKQLRREVLKKMRPQDVVIEKESSNTYANALWLAQYAQDHGWKRVILLTSSYHMKRAKFIFEHVLKSIHSPVDLETLSVTQDPFTSDDWKTGPNGIRVTLMEYIKWIYYRSVLK